MRNRENVIEYLLNETESEYTAEELEKMSDWDLLDAWLIWNGIVGWTDNILEVCENLGLPERPNQEDDLIHPKPNLKGKLVLQMYTGGQWKNIGYADDTPEGLAWLEARYNDNDNLDMRIEMFT